MAAASSLFNALNGIFCVYKPPGKSISLVVRALQMNLARGLRFYGFLSQCCHLLVLIVIVKLFINS